MKILILFAVWAPDESENSHRWLNWYRELLEERFPDDDIFVAVSSDACSRAKTRYEDLPNLLGIDIVPEDLHVNSDASQYQYCLSRCRSIIKDYDYILFMQTKGISYFIGNFQPWRVGITKTIFNRREVIKAASSKDYSIIADRGFMITDKNSILNTGVLAKSIGITLSVFNFAAATTLYYARADLVDKVISGLSKDFLEKNLLLQGHTRFLFEGTFPSLVAMCDSEPYFLCNPRFNAGLSPEISYDFDPQHSSALVLREFHRRRQEGTLYRQVPTPYVFGEPSDISKLKIVFAV